MGVACGLTFRQQMNIISISGELPGFIVRLTSFTSKHTSFECQIAVNESEKVVFKPIQTALMPVRTTYFRKWENRNKNPDNEAHWPISALLHKGLRVLKKKKSSILHLFYTIWPNSPPIEHSEKTSLLLARVFFLMQFYRLIVRRITYHLLVYKSAVMSDNDVISKQKCLQRLVGGSTKRFYCFG